MVLESIAIEGLVARYRVLKMELYFISLHRGDSVLMSALMESQQEEIKYQPTTEDCSI